MSVTIDFSGLDDLERKLKSMNKPQEVPLSELFHDKFMQQYTNFSTIDAMFQAMKQSGFVIESPYDFETLPEEDIDAFVASHTQFATWQTMLTEAGGDYVLRQLGI